MDELDAMKIVRSMFEQRLQAITSERGKKLTHREIADECGLAQSAVSLYLRGFVLEAKFMHLCTFLNWLGIPPSEFAERLGIYRPKVSA